LAEKNLPLAWHIMAATAKKPPKCASGYCLEEGRSSRSPLHGCFVIASG
jgi:hypothetical protein